MDSTQRTVRIFGVLFIIITFITSIPAYALFQPVLDDPARYIAGAGKDNRSKDREQHDGGADVGDDENQL